VPWTPLFPPMIFLFFFHAFTASLSPSKSFLRRLGPCSGGLFRPSDFPPDEGGSLMGAPYPPHPTCSFSFCSDKTLCPSHNNCLSLGAAPFFFPPLPWTSIHCSHLLFPPNKRSAFFLRPRQHISPFRHPPSPLLQTPPSPKRIRFFEPPFLTPSWFSKLPPPLFLTPQLLSPLIQANFPLPAWSLIPCP